MQAIRAWLGAAPPAEAAALMRENPAYIFFRRLPGLAADAGPQGSLGVPLTPGRSLAVDPAFIPLGAPVFLATRDPLDGRPIHRLMLAQDTGRAIRGPARADLFWGWGAAAAARAGPMQEAGELFLLLPRASPLGCRAAMRSLSFRRARGGPQIARHAQNRPRVALFVTCLVDLYRPNVGFSAIALLEEAGCQVEVPPAQTCCGQPAYNTGDRATAKDLARR